MNRRFLRSPYAVVVLIALVVALMPLVLPSLYYMRVAALVLIFALAVVGLNLLMGFAGQVSLGHAGFFGIGAYAVAIGPTHLGIPSWASLVLGAAAAGLMAFIVGRPILRLRGHYLAVATLGLGLLIALVFTNEAAWTGGSSNSGRAGRSVRSCFWIWCHISVRLAGSAILYSASNISSVLGFEYPMALTNGTFRICLVW